MGGVGELVDYPEPLLPGPGATRHIELLAAVFRSRQQSFRERHPDPALIPRQVVSAGTQDRRGHRLCPPDLQYLLPPPSESDGLRRHTLQPGLLSDAERCANISAIQFYSPVPTP